MSNFFLSALFVLWIGLILGVSFIAMPLKFMAPHLMMPVALEIGKVTFHIFNKIEWGIFLLVFLLTLNISGHSLKWFFSGSLLILLLLETFQLLPALDLRADLVIAGGSANPGTLHWIYIVADILKMIITLVGACWVLYKVRNERKSYN